MTNPSTFIIILTSAFSQSLAQSAMSQQQLLVQTSDFTFSTNQEPITINYLVEIQEFTTDQIKQLRESVTSIANTNDYNLAVDLIDGTPRDLFLKTLHLKLLAFNQNFTDTLEILNTYLTSHRNRKHDFTYGNFACNMSQDLYRRNIPDALLKEIKEHQERPVRINDSDVIDINSEKHKKLKNSISNILRKLYAASKDLDELFD